MTVEILEITPAMAKEMLKRNDRNFRKRREGLVQRLAADMPHWDLNGESIKFDANGNLIDGQHRLLACIKANCSFRTVVFRGADRDTNIDTGAKRSLVDILRHRGESYAGELSAGLSWLYRYQAVARGDYAHPYSMQKVGISNDVLLETLRSHPDIRHSLVRGRQVRAWLPASLTVGLHYVASRCNREYADGFIDSLEKGVSLLPEDPVFHLRSRLEKDKASKARLLPVEKAALAIIAWNFTVQNRPMKNLKWIAIGPRPEPFPLIVDDRGEPVSVVGNFVQRAA